ECHQLAACSEVDLRALKDEHFLEQRSVRLYQTIETAHPATRPNLTLNAPDLDSVLALIGVGLGVAFISRYVADTINWRGVVYRPITPPAPDSEFVLVRRAPVSSPALWAFPPTTRH